MRYSTFTFNIQRRNIRQLFVMYCIVLGYIVFLTPNRYESGNYIANLLPFIHTMERIHKPAGEIFWKYYTFYWGNIFGNIVLFMPFGFLVKWLYPKRNQYSILLYALMLSASIELIQLLLKIGVCDIDDVILNVTGAFNGTVIFNYLKRQRYISAILSTTQNNK